MSGIKKTALVTGANKGIGKEVVKQLASRGFQVFLGARDEERGKKAIEEIHAQGLTDVHFLTIDVASDDSVKAAAETLEAQIESLDVLVNNAGISAGGFKGPWEESLEDIKASYDVNFYGPIRMIRAFEDLLKKSKAGRVVNVGSELGSLKNQSDPTHRFYPYNSIGYPSSKTALNAVTIAFAKALDDWKIKVNTADPGYTATDINGHSGSQTVDVGAQSIVFLATLPDDGPTGSYQDKDGVLPW